MSPPSPTAPRSPRSPLSPAPASPRHRQVAAKAMQTLINTVTPVLGSKESKSKTIIDRLRHNDPELIRLDITASLFQDWTQYDKMLLLQAIPQNHTVTAIHLSGLDLESMLSEDQITSLVMALAQLAPTVEDLCVFRGGCRVLTEALTALLIERLENLQTLLLFQFAQLHDHPVLASALRQHVSLERVTLTLPSTTLPWGCMDVYAMGFAQMPNLRVLQLRCTAGSGHYEFDFDDEDEAPPRQQQDPIISPEAVGLLFNSKTIQSLYLENIGLLDDHMDVLAEELPRSSSNSSSAALQSLDVKDNLFTDDAVYTVAAMLPQINHTHLTSLDMSGCPMTLEAGQALAAGMSRNTRLTHLELQGDADRFKDEFDVPAAWHETPETHAWAQQIYYHIRLNRAHPASYHINNANDVLQDSKADFVNALNAVSDQIDCLYHFVRTYPKHCEGAHHCRAVPLDMDSATPAQQALIKGM